MTDPNLSDAPVPKPRHRVAPICVDRRYDVEDQLARGGMALVYRARDKVTGRMVALKWLDMYGAAEQQLRRHIDLFEREYHILQQLSHPRVVQCYEYGVHDGNPFYTMELLDGGDLRDLAPLPWQDVCRIAYDVCSALSLLHSRQLVHLDVSPRNVRRTADGTAKLIDFGLLAPMGVCALAAGTPAFMAPEVLCNVTVDGRADLFSLGATLYYVLTGRAAYPVQRIEDLHKAWLSSPTAPARVVPAIPAALSALVLSMVRVDIGSRPKNAAEVMETLSPMMEAVPGDLSRISHAYLNTPKLVGCDEIVQSFRKRALRALRHRAEGFVISGVSGVGRSRILDAFALEAKLVGAVIVRASSADSASGPFGAALALVRQLLASLPEEASRALQVSDVGHALATAATRPVRQLPLGDPSRPELDHTALYDGLRSFFLRCSQAHILAIALDDLHSMDEASVSLLAGLVTASPPARILYAATLEAGAHIKAQRAVDVLLAHAERITLSPLNEEQLSSLLRSVFGDVSGLQLLTQRVYRLCGGRPRECMAIARQLVEDRAITYTNGTWSLPDSYVEGQLPASLEELFQRQVSHLSAAARQLAGLLGLALVPRFTRAQLLDSFGSTRRAEAVRALDELLSAQLLTSDPAGHALCHDEHARHILRSFDEREVRALHDQLAGIYEASAANPLIIAHHQLSGAEPARGLRSLLDNSPDPVAWEALLTRAQLQLTVEAIGKTLLLALRTAEREHASRRDLIVLRERLAHQTTLGDDPAHYYGVAADCLEQYKLDCGYYAWQACDPSLPDKARAERAIAQAFERWNSTPEAERVLAPIDAIKALVRWVAMSLPIAARLGDLNLSSSLDELLTPFTSLSPLVNLMARNARAARLSRCESRVEDARQLWADVLGELDTRTDLDVVYRTRMRTTICCAIGASDAMLGIPSDWLQRLEHADYDQTQLPQVYSIQKLTALSHGDWTAAEAHRKRAEAIELRYKSQVISTLYVETLVHAAARDLTGLKRVRQAIHAMAAKYPHWAAARHIADAYYARLRGDFEHALSAAELALVEAVGGDPSAGALPSALVAKVELLTDLNRSEEALAVAQPALAHYRARGMHHFARTLERALALTDAKLGRLEAARTRIEAVIRAQSELGVGGLQLGLSYEVAARVAILALDRAQFDHYAALTAACYQRGRGSVLGALYERLQEDARAAGLVEPGVPVLGAFADATAGSNSASGSQHVQAVMRNYSNSSDRARAALLLLCSSAASDAGMLFLVSPAGLTLTAATVDPTWLETAHPFAQRFLNAELERIHAQDEHTVTMHAMIGSAAVPNQWCAPDGTGCTAMLLSGILNGQQVIVGVAILRGSNLSTTGLSEIASALTQCLVDADIAPSAVITV